MKRNPKPWTAVRCTPPQFWCGEHPDFALRETITAERLRGYFHTGNRPAVAP